MRDKKVFSFVQVFIIAYIGGLCDGYMDLFEVDGNYFQKYECHGRKRGGEG